MLQPDEVAHGASPSGGADELAEQVAIEHYREHGLAPDEHVRRFPMERAIDGDGGAAFLRRNARMGETVFPGMPRDADVRPRLPFVPLGASFVVGRVGQAVGTRGNYLSNGSQSMVAWLLDHHVPTVVFREDGIEPLTGVRGPDIAGAVDLLRRLFLFSRDLALVAPGKALVSLWEATARHEEVGRLREEVLTALACAREASRFAPWIEAVEKTVSRAS